MLKLPLPILSKNPDILTTKLTHQAAEVSIKPPPPDFDFSQNCKNLEPELQEPPPELLYLANEGTFVLIEKKRFGPVLAWRNC
uniref:Uncharacterized protein n=1 Tax=Salix viminalis TaxID=40686 RepID=A0A6N2NHJ1_SALVM